MPSTPHRFDLVVALLVCGLALAGAEPPEVTGSRRGPSPSALGWTAASRNPLGSGQVSALAIAPGNSQWGGRNVLTCNDSTF
jgi:hypothetical protein